MCWSTHHVGFANLHSFGLLWTSPLHTKDSSEDKIPVLGDFIGSPTSGTSASSTSWQKMHGSFKDAAWRRGRRRHNSCDNWNKRSLAQQYQMTEPYITRCVWYGLTILPKWNTILILLFASPLARVLNSRCFTTILDSQH